MDFSAINVDFWILQTIAMMVTCFLLPRLTVSGPLGALGAVVALAFVNAQVWDAALFFQVPDSLSAHALVLMLSNGLVFWVVVKILPGIEVEGILPAIAAPIVFTICSLLISHYGKDIEWQKVWDKTLVTIVSIRDSLSPSSSPTPKPQ